MYKLHLVKASNIVACEIFDVLYLKVVVAI
jgi:hypothetical protein